MSVKSALYNYIDRQAKKEANDKPKRKNKTPEYDLQAEIIKTAKKDGFKFYITDSSARWSYEKEGYVSETFESGMSDLTGDRDGLACYIEIKAPGKRSTLKPHQREFLMRKIGRGCFACCVDSYELITETWDKWRQSGNYSMVLIKCLPREPVSRDKDDDLF